MITDPLWMRRQSVHVLSANQPVIKRPQVLQIPRIAIIILALERVTPPTLSAFSVMYTNGVYRPSKQPMGAVLVKAATECT